MIQIADHQFVNLRELQLDGLTYVLGVERSEDGFCGCWACETCEVAADGSNDAPTCKAAESRARTNLVAHHALFHLANLARISDEALV